MRLLNVPPDDLTLSAEFGRSGKSKSFEDRLRSSIDQIGLVEPLKVVPGRDGGYVVIDGAMRLRAIRALRERDGERFVDVQVYLYDFESRFELRYQSDIYQDLLPSQLATLVEHLHKSEHVRKVDIARYIGVSPATLRNYTGLWRLIERGGLFTSVVELMDLGVFPSSTPYAWLRLTEFGLYKVLAESFGDGQEPADWVSGAMSLARGGAGQRYTLQYVEAVTGSLPSNCYRGDDDSRALKRDLGLRRLRSEKGNLQSPRSAEVGEHLDSVSRDSSDLALRSVADSLREYFR